MPDDIGRRLTYHPAQHCLRLAIKGSQALRDVDFNACSLERDPSRRQLGGEGRLPVARHHLPYLLKRFPAETHDVSNLIGSLDPLRKKASCHLALQGDQGETVAEQIV